MFEPVDFVGTRDSCFCFFVAFVSAFATVFFAGFFASLVDVDDLVDFFDDVADLVVVAFAVVDFFAVVVFVGLVVSFADFAAIFGFAVTTAGVATPIARHHTTRLARNMRGTIHATFPEWISKSSKR